MRILSYCFLVGTGHAIYIQVSDMPTNGSVYTIVYNNSIPTPTQTHPHIFTSPPGLQWPTAQNFSNASDLNPQGSGADHLEGEMRGGLWVALLLGFSYMIG